MCWQRAAPCGKELSSVPVALAPGHGAMVRRLERDLPELHSVFRCLAHLRKKVRTTNIIERCFVEVRRRTRPMACFVNLESVDRIISSTFQRFNLEWKNPHPPCLYTSS